MNRSNSGKKFFNDSCSEEHRAKLIAVNTGKSLSGETKRKISEANRGKQISEEHKAAISIALKGNPGKPCSEETKSKLSAANKGCASNRKGCSLLDITKKKIGDANKGKVTVLNLETNEVSSIQTGVFYSRRDIYFTTQSKVFKEWKSNSISQHSS